MDVAPWTRQKRMLRLLKNKQLPAAAQSTQPAVSGQRGKAAWAVRSHGKKPRDRLENDRFRADPGFFVLHGFREISYQLTV